MTYPLFSSELGCSHKHTFNGSMLMVVTFDFHYYIKLQIWASFWKEEKVKVSYSSFLAYFGHVRYRSVDGEMSVQKIITFLNTFDTHLLFSSSLSITLQPFTHTHTKAPVILLPPSLSLVTVLNWSCIFHMFSVITLHVSFSLCLFVSSSFSFSLHLVVIVPANALILVTRRRH